MNQQVHTVRTTSNNTLEIIILDDKNGTHNKCLKILEPRNM